jgi:hypothetical protein
MKNLLKKTANVAGTALMLVFVLCSATLAQEVTGSIVGTVQDVNGAAVPNATVTITDPTKNDIVVRTITTSDDGTYSAPNLPVSIYQVTVEAASFKKSVQTDVKLDVGQRRTVDFSLEAGNIAEVVTVEADQLGVELNTPTAATTIGGDQVRELSVNNRNFVQLVALAPGVSSNLDDQVYVGTTNPEGQANTVGLSVNGARSSQNTFTVDGADITDRGSNLTIQGYPSIDSIGEFRVLRSLYPAESGRSGGGQVNVITRSGTDKFHGTLYEFVRNEKFNANTYFNNQRAPLGRDENGKAIRPPFRYNNYGWNLGGPIYFLNFGEGGDVFKRYERTFFFFSQEFRKDRRSTTFTPTVPDADLRKGIFPIDVCINRNNITTENCNAGNPGRLAAGTPLPASFFNPTAVAYLNNIYNQLPLPNNPSVRYQLVSSLPGIADFRQEIFKLDHSFTKNWSSFYRYQRDTIPTIDANGLFASGSGLPGVATQSTDSPGRAHTFQTTYVISPNLIAEGRYSYSYGAILSNVIGSFARDNAAIPVTLPFAVTRDKSPTISANGFSALQAFGNYDNFSDKHNYSTSLTWINGNHTMKFGGGYSLYRKNENAVGGSNEGLFNTFSATLASGVTSNVTNQNIQRWANFLVGNVASFTQSKFDLTADLRQKNFEGYAQDEWKIRSNLTLYYGVRYSYFGMPYDRNGRLTNFVPELFNKANAPLITGAGNRVAGTGNFCNGLIFNAQNPNFTMPANCTSLTPSPYGDKVANTPNKDFAPRVGLAWDPFGKGKTSIRTGYGIYHEQFLNGVFLQNIGTNPPYQETVTITNTRLDNPLAGTATAPSLGATSLRAIQADWKTPYMQHWSLDLQQQLTSKTIVTIGYYGSKGTNLIGIVDINLLPPGLARSSQCAPGNTYIGQTPTTATVQCQPNGFAFRNTDNVALNPNVVGTTRFTDALILDQLRPYRGYRAINMIQPRFNSNYHSMQLSANHRFSGLSQVNLAYTWSKNLTDNQTDRSTAAQNPYDVGSEYGRAQLDRRHIFTLNYVYELPFYRDQQGFVGKLLGGWEASGIITYNTGLPFTATTGTNVLDPSGIGLIGTSSAGSRPNILCNPNENAPHTQGQFFNTSCFQSNPAIQAFTTAPADVILLSNAVGTAGRGVINGPSTSRVDFSLMKNIRFGESMRLQLRGEAFNVLNTTNFRGLDTAINSTTFGFVTAPTRDPRVLQFAAKFYF